MAKAGKKLNDVHELSGLQKAAVLVLSLDADASGKVLNQLNEELLEEVTREIASIGEVAEEVKASVIEEFYGLIMAQNWATEGGLDHAERLLKKHVDQKMADKVLQQISRQVQQTPFAF
jgi:flagellar motor switch protein FliG